MMNRILVKIFLKKGPYIKGWLEVWDHGFDLRFFRFSDNSRINPELIKRWDL